MALITLTIDDQKVAVEEGTNLIEAAKKIGLHIPHFCYHPGLTPDGNCRMCLVAVKGMRGLVVGCKTGAKEGMVVRTNEEVIQKARAAVMEFLLIQHPLDCPTCDQAGECKLQDYYMDYDLKPSRYKEEKVQKRKMVDLGANVMLDEDRCVVCRRCVRFCKEIAKKEELYVQERGHHSVVATFPGQELTSLYSGCVVDVCPVGALTSKDFRYKKRVWFLTCTDSICPGCSRGCNVSLHHEKGTVYRLKPRFNSKVNQYWMCDIGRYNYRFLNEQRRLKTMFRTEEGCFEVGAVSDGIAHLKKTMSEFAPYQIAFVASAKESCESIDVFVGAAKENFSQDFVYYSKHMSQTNYSDDILITKDKNPNLNYVKKLGLKPVSEMARDIKAVIVQRDLSPDDHALMIHKGIKILALFATNQTNIDEMALTIFPIPTYAEQEGHFVNFEGQVQKFEKAFEPKGEAQEIQNYLKELI